MNHKTERANSWYSATALHNHEYPALDNDIEVDVVIIGGGLTGIASAVELVEKGHSVCVLEARRVGWGATGRNGGQITGSLSGDQAMHRQLARRSRVDAEQFVWNLRWRGHEIIKKRVEKYSIDCDLKHGHLHAAYKPSHLEELRRSYEEACRHGMEDEVTLLEKSDVPDYLGTDIYHGALLNRRNMHVHSLNLCLGEARAASELGANIHENSEVISIEHGDRPLVRTSSGSVKAKHVLLAGNAYHRLERKHLSGLLFPASLANMTTVRLEPEIVKALNPHDLAVYDTRFVLDYYRTTSDGRLMFGGGANYSAREPESIAAQLLPALVATFPQLEGIDIEYQWTGMAGITINRIPQFGMLSSNVFYVQGYSGHGIATSHIAAQITANAISGSDEEFELMSSFRHMRVPFGDAAGQCLLALGMFYYQMKERFT